MSPIPIEIVLEAPVMDTVETAEALYAMHYFVPLLYLFMIALVFILIFLPILVFLAMDITRLPWPVKQIIKKISTGYLQIYTLSIRSLKI